AARAKARTRAMTPLHHHPVPEFCLALSGRAAMHMGERCWLLSPPALAVLTPGLRHAEGYARRGQPYTLLWFTAFSTSSVVAIISQYAASGRCQVLHNLLLRTRGIGAIVRRFDGRQPIDRGAVESLRADLLLLVSQLLRTRPAPASNTR